MYLSVNIRNTAVSRYDIHFEVHTYIRESDSKDIRRCTWTLLLFHRRLLLLSYCCQAASRVPISRDAGNRDDAPTCLFIPPLTLNPKHKPPSLGHAGKCGATNYRFILPAVGMIYSERSRVPSLPRALSTSLSGGVVYCKVHTNPNPNSIRYTTVYHGYTAVHGVLGCYDWRESQTITRITLLRLSHRRAGDAAPRLQGSGENAEDRRKQPPRQDTFCDIRRSRTYFVLHTRSDSSPLTPPAYLWHHR